MDFSTTMILLGAFLGQDNPEKGSRKTFELEENTRSDAKGRKMGDRTKEQGLLTVVTRLIADEARPIATTFNLQYKLVNLADDHCCAGNFQP